MEEEIKSESIILSKKVKKEKPADVIILDDSDEEGTTMLQADDLNTIPDRVVIPKKLSDSTDLSAAIKKKKKDKKKKKQKDVT
ncbi:Hypothetical predicted protein [Mytilus galloprovincialis]|uniref:Uncharacterized protein n=2 Tax=Mytilus galloprovincialis TaxID=29158 RepID=A0A8B6DKV2_MYTGA|nr:Hypothetical predicted protein [Mytilus galloprovincialis]